MKTLNLADKTKSDIDYKIINYPDGQRDVLLLDNGGVSVRVMIRSRMNSFADLELIAAAKSAVQRQSATNHTELYVPYLLGARSDRVFQKGGSHYLADVIAATLNNLGFNKVNTLDVHSSAAKNAVFRLENRHPTALLLNVEEYLDKSRRVLIVAPDAGAKGRASYASGLWNNTPLITFQKKRDVNGDITGTGLDPDESDVIVTDDYTGDFAIIDDICDGGRTFIEIAKVLNEMGFTNNKKHLVVTHGIFSKGLDELKQYFTSIHTTNSRGQFDDPFIQVTNVL